MNFSSYFGLGISGHRDIDFVDIRLNTDTPFYVDAERIMLCDHPLATTATALVDDYYATLFHAAVQKDRRRLLRLLSFGREPNETHLGLSMAHSRGKGSSPDILFPIIEEMIRLHLFDAGLITQIIDLHLWTPNFGPDRLSDLTTNILRGVLYDYTIEQFRLYGITVPRDSCISGVAWDMETHDWKAYSFPNLRAGPYHVLLVPKSFVGQKMLSSPGELLQKYALRYRQEEHLRQLTVLCHEKLRKDGSVKWEPPTKRELRDFEIKGRSEKGYMLDIGYRHPEMVREMHWDHRHGYHGSIVPVSDDTFDSMLYSEEYLAV